MASVPPVEAPTMMSFSVDEKWVRAGAGAAPACSARTCAPGADAVAEPAAATGAAARGRSFARAAARILSAIWSAYSFMPSRMPSLGLATKSTAPSSSARSVASEPRSVSEEIMTTGVGRRRMSFSRKSRPSIFGISTSSVSTSGLVCLMRSRAMIGSGATPTTSISGWLLMISFRMLRISAESSMHST